MQYISRAGIPIEKCFVELCMQISFHVNRTEGLPTQPKLGDKQNFERFICIHCTRYHFPLEFTKKKKHDIIKIYVLKEKSISKQKYDKFSFMSSTFKILIFSQFFFFLKGSFSKQPKFARKIMLYD